MSIMNRCSFWFYTRTMRTGRLVLMGTRHLHSSERCNGASAAYVKKTKGSYAKGFTDSERIIIPRKIPRDELTILKALSSTVERDTKGPDYVLIDDANLIPISQLESRTAYMSKLAGRHTARYLMHNSRLMKFMRHPPMYDETVKTAFPFDFPLKYKYGLDTIAGLRERIAKRRVRDVATSYARVRKILLKNGEDIPQDLKRDVFEMQCFSNSRDIPRFKFEEEVKSVVEKKETEGRRKKKWRKNNLAEIIFSNTENPDAAMYEALLRGRAKFGDNAGVWQLYSEMKEKGFPISVEAYNAVLQTMHKPNEESVKSILQEMKENNVLPNAKTMVRLLNLRVDRHEDFLLKVANEMIAIGLEPPLTIYNRIIQNAYWNRAAEDAPKDKRVKRKGPALLNKVLDHMKSKSYQLVSPQDYYFFRGTLFVCADLKEMDAAFKVFELFFHGQNYKLLPERGRITFFGKLIAMFSQAGEIEKAMEVYSRVVPFFYNPGPSVLMIILEEMQNQPAYHHIPKLWSDLARQENFPEKIIKLMLKICAQKKEFEKDELWLKRQIAEISVFIYTKYCEDEEIRANNVRPQKSTPRTTLIYPLTSQMFGHIMQILMNTNKFPKAWEVFTTYSTNRNKYTGQMSEEPLVMLLDNAIVKNKNRKAITVLSVLQYSNSRHVARYIHKAKNALKFDEEELKQIEAIEREIKNNETRKWKKQKQNERQDCDEGV